jgi:hypothetical protein
MVSFWDDRWFLFGTIDGDLSHQFACVRFLGECSGHTAHAPRSLADYVCKKLKRVGRTMYYSKDGAGAANCIVV